VFVGLKPSMALSDLVRDVKNNSTNFINDHAWIKGKFCWQEGYGAFSYSHSQIENVYNYILNQESTTARRHFKLNTWTSSKNSKSSMTSSTCLSGSINNEADHEKTNGFCPACGFYHIPACQLLFLPELGQPVLTVQILSQPLRIFNRGYSQHLLETGAKQGDEFDANSFFAVLTHISMRAGYLLDYVYQVDGLGAYPLLYARPRIRPLHFDGGGNSATQLPDFHEYWTLTMWNKATLNMSSWISWRTVLSGLACQLQRPGDYL